MKAFTIYSTITGEILRHGFCPDLDFDHQAQEDEAIVEGTYHPDTHYFVEGTLTEKPQKPDTEYCSWDGSAWQINLDAVKSEKKRQIDNWRLLMEQRPIAYDSKVIDADPKSRENINGRIVQLQSESALNLPSTGFFWKDANNNLHTWTNVADYLQWLQGLAIALATRSSALYEQAWAKKALVDAMTTFEEVNNYDPTA